MIYEGVLMKRFNLLELFLYAMAMICFLVALFSFIGLLNDVATLVFPEVSTANDSYYAVNSDVYLKRGLISQVPLFFIGAASFVYIVKKAIKVHKEEFLYFKNQQDLIKK